MKKITFILCLMACQITIGQSLPLDFEVAEDNGFTPFNGATVGVVTDPTNGANTVLQLTSGGVDFDGAAMALDTYIDLSNDSNNTIGFQMWAPDATTRTHLLKFEGSAAGATEIYFTTSAMGWQTINVDFGASLANDYTTIVIFADSGVGNTATGTYYIDDVTGTNGTVIPLDPVPMVAAATPNAPNAEVLSIYGDTGGFTNIWTPDYTFGTTQGEVDLGSGSVNNARKINLSIAGYGEGTNAVTDISSYDYLQFDYWADATSTEVKFFIIGNNGSVQEYTYTIASSGGDAILVNEAWTHVEVPLSFFTNNGFSKSHLFQWKLDATSNLMSDFVYLDNVFFSQQPLSVSDFELQNVNVFPNPTQSSWTINTANENITKINVFDVLGKEVIALTPNISEVAIDASALNSGMYIVKVETNTGSKVLKLVKN